MTDQVESYTNQSLIALYDLDNDSPHHCGYCDRNGSISNGMEADLLQVNDYQSLIDRGWRRSGSYCYKPIMKKTCCPLYTIKCDAINVRLTKTQKNVLNNMKNYLEKGIKPEQKQRNTENQKKNDSKSSKSQAAAAATAEGSTVTSKSTKSNEQKASSDTSKAETLIKYVFDNLTNKNMEIPENMKLKAKQKRLFKKLLKLNSKNLLEKPEDVEKYLKRRNNKNTPLSLEDKMKISDNAVNKLEVVLVRSWPPTKEFRDNLNEEHKVYTQYQTQIHNDSVSKCSMNQFQRFLCMSPLSSARYNNGCSKGYGSFHQLYKLNGKIIAVGVIDILSDCVSSVYFFYNPEYQFLNLGTYSALREIALVRELYKEDPKIKWYYLGFYAHRCQKMRYKGQYQPSYLLCPETYTWHPIKECIELLNNTKYNRFEKDETKVDKFDENTINEVKFRLKLGRDEYVCVKFKDFLDFLNPVYAQTTADLVKGYCKLFGEEFSKNVYIKY